MYADMSIVTISRQTIVHPVDFTHSLLLNRGSTVSGVNWPVPIRQGKGTALAGVLLRTQGSAVSSVKLIG